MSKVEVTQTGESVIDECDTVDDVLGVLGGSLWLETKGFHTRIETLSVARRALDVVLAKAADKARAEGRAEERRDVVAWLRSVEGWRPAKLAESIDDEYHVGAHELHGTWSDGDVMPRVGGKSFHCECGGNVFKKSTVGLKYKCNSCEAVFVGEAAKDSP